MNISIIAFEDFTDIDVFLLWDLLNRVTVPNWQVRLLGDAAQHTSRSGLTIPMHGHIREANDADAVLFTSGPGARKKYQDATFLGAFQLDPTRQLIGSMCSGALILATLGLLEGKEATTYPTTKAQLERLGVTVVERRFVRHGNIATAAGCLAAQDLAGWVIERLTDAAMKDLVLKSIQPVGEGLFFDEGEEAQRIYATRGSS